MKRMFRMLCCLLAVVMLVLMMFLWLIRLAQ
jgi:hypothetical protein